MLVPHICFFVAQQMLFKLSIDLVLMSYFRMKMSLCLSRMWLSRLTSVLDMKSHSLQLYFIWPMFYIRCSNRKSNIVPPGKKIGALKPQSSFVRRGPLRNVVVGFHIFYKVSSH